MKTRFVILLISMWCPFAALAQNRQVDSLLKRYNTSANDTSRVNVLLALSKLQLSVDPNEAARYARQAGVIADSLGFENGRAASNKYVGLAFWVKGEYVEALHYFEQALVLYKAVGDKAGQTSLLKNIGSVFGHQGDDEKALDYYLQALKLSEEIKDTLQQVSSLSNIGTIYMYKAATHHKAFQFLRQAYALSTRSDDQNVIGSVAVNLGELYLAKEQYDSAMHYFNVSIKAFEGTADVAYTMNNIGKLYLKQKRYDQAVAIQQAAIDIAKQYDAQDNVLASLIGIAQSYEQQGNVQMSLSYYQQAEQNAKAMGDKYALIEVFQGLAEAHAALTDYPNAFRYQALLTAMKDTVYNLETDKKLGTLQFTYDLDKKTAEISLLNKDRELKTKELSRQKMVRNGFIGGFLAVLFFAGVIFTQRNRIAKEKDRSEKLLLNILPEETAHELKHNGKAKARRHENVSVLFTDFKGFSNQAESMDPELLVEVIDHYFRAFDKIVSNYGIEKIKTIGDSYMCACGLPTPDDDHAYKTVKAAIDMREFVARESIHRGTHGLPYFDIRIGVHSGPVVAGIVGESKFVYDIWGDTVNMASRMESSGAPGKVNVSGVTHALIKDRFECTHRGKVSVKHKDGVEMFFVEREFDGGMPLRNGFPEFEVNDYHPLLKHAVQTPPGPKSINEKAKSGDAV